MRIQSLLIGMFLLTCMQSGFAQWTYNGTGFFADDLTVGPENNNVGDGKKIRFGYNGNTDPLWIGRYNVSSDATELRVNISDDGQATDKFVVGFQPYSGPWVTAMTVGANGHSVFGNGLRIYTGTYDNNATYADLRTNLSSGNTALNAPTNALFLNYDHGTNGVNFGDGQSNIVAKVESNGNAWFNGNVGIGTSSPTYKLDVVGNEKVHNVAIDNGVVDGGRLIFSSQGNPEWRVRNFNGLGFYPGEGQPTSLWLDNSGSVCIGEQNSHGFKLAVNGSAIFTKIAVKAYTNWPDYVFNTTYRLRPLSEVEKYINEHHHLPEVQSAEEIEKNGLDVADNQATLLKKVEELTLYMIELNKQVKELREENAQLKKLVIKNN